MRKLALLGIDLLALFLMLGVGGFAFLYFNGDERVFDKWADFAFGSAALILLLIGRVGVKRANALGSILALLICAAYAVHFAVLFLEQGTFENAVTWIAATGSVVGLLATLSRIVLKTPPVSKKGTSSP
jgi:hypothetical protein